MAEKKIVELEVKDNLGNLKQQLKQAQLEVQILSDKFGATSKQAVEAAKAAAILKDKIADAKQLTDAFNPDAKFKAVTGSLTGVAGAFSVVTGAMGAFGVQSEGVEKALLKVQSAMAMASGLQAVGESIDTFKQLGAVIKNTTIFQTAYNYINGITKTDTKDVVTAKVLDTEATIAQGAAITGTATATGTATLAMKAFKIALISTGIGALVAGIAYLASKFMEASESSDKLKKSQKAADDAAKEQSSTIAKESGAFALLISRLKDTNNGSIERKKLIKQVNDTYGTTFTNLKDEAKFQFALNQELANYLVYQTKKYELQKNEKFMNLNLEKQDEINRKLKESQNNLNKAIKEGAGETKKAKVDIEDKFFQDVLVNEQATKIAENERENIKKLIKAQDDAKVRFANYGAAANDAGAAVAELTNNGKKFVEQTTSTTSAVDKNTDTIKLINDNLIAYYDAIEQNRQSKITSDKEKEQQELANKYEALYLLADKAGKSTKDLQEQQGKDSQAITKKYNDLEKAAKDEKDKLEKERVEKEKTFLQSITLSQNELKLANLAAQYEAEKLLYVNNKEILAALDLKYLEDKKKLEDEAAVKVKEREKMLLDFKLDTALKGLQLITDLSEMFGSKNAKQAKKAFNIQKAASIASTLIQTYQAAQSAYASQFVPIPDQSSPVRGAIAAGLAVASGLVKVAKIAKTKFEGGGGGDGGGGGGAATPTMSAPQFNVVGQSGVNQLASLNQQPIQAYVVSGQVTSQQALDRNRLENATLGG